MSAESKAVYRERFHERDVIRDFCLLLKLPYRALLHSAGVDYARYWRSETSPAENDRVRAIARECELHPDRIARMKEEFWTAYPEQRPVYPPRAKGVST